MEKRGWRVFCVLDVRLMGFEGEGGVEDGFWFLVWVVGWM